MSRANKIRQLKDRQRTQENAKAKTERELVAALNKAAQDIGESLGAGVDINNLDALLQELRTFREISPQIQKLEEALKELPKSFKVTNMAEFVQSIKSIKLQPQFSPKIITKQPDYSKLVEKIFISLTLIKTAVEKSVYTPSQKPEDFLPVRRVRKVGNRFLFDDGEWTGGGAHMVGGGGSIPEITVRGQRTVPVANPDGTSIGGSSSGLTDIQLRATPVPISGTVTAGAPTVSTSTDVSLASSASSTQLLAANPSRKGLILTNTDANPVYLYYGTTATSTKFTVRIVQNAYWEMPQPIYTGRIDVIWSADGAGSLIGSEL